MTGQGRLAEAAGYFEEVLRIKPGDAAAKQHLDAISHFSNRPMR
jgi:hypothetical protein